MEEKLISLFFSAGPAECLFEQPYYEKMKKALKPGGIICAQGKTCIYQCL